MGTFENSLSFAQEQDKKDALSGFRDMFYIPSHQGEPVIYFNGNSLGLQPRKARVLLEEEMLKWEKLAVEGHFNGVNPWLSYHKLAKESLCYLLGTQAQEVTVMNSLTVNLHLLLVSFYRPQGKRTKILMEGSAFPSDHYVLESQARFHGLDPEEVVVEVLPRAGEQTLRTEDIIAKIEEIGDELALLMFGGVNYYTGQFFELDKICQAAQGVGAKVGYDLAHAIGNVPLSLHEWGVDFASWCSYKYLNSSPGGISGVYIHEKHVQDESLPRFNGWWGYDEKTRFQMKKGFVPEPNVDAWQLSNAPILLLAVHRASLEIYDQAGMKALRAKSIELTAYLEFILKEITQKYAYGIEVITPSEPEARGCQLSLYLEKSGKILFDDLQAQGVRMDWREPNVIRLAPVPLYNGFEDVFNFGQKLEIALQKISA